MRKLIGSLVVGAMLVVPAMAAAQDVPHLISFTSRLTDNGAPITGPHDVTFRIFESETGGAARWTEPHAALLVENDGLLTLSLGQVTPLDGTLFTGADLYLEVTVDNATLSPRMRIVSVPYAIRAEEAKNAATVGTLAPEDIITEILAGNGLSGGGAGGSITIAADTTVLQRRITQACNSGQSIRAINADGTVVCADDASNTGDITSVVTAAGSGLVGGVMSGDANMSLMTCAGGQILKFDAGGTGWGCADEVAYTAGAGLVLDVLEFSIAFAPASTENGSAMTAARSDHLHDARYATRMELMTPGTLNSPMNPVEWTRLQGVPADLADGVDSDTTYSAGPGLALSTTNAFSVVYPMAGTESGSSTTAARADHVHDARYFTEAELSDPMNTATLNTMTNPVSFNVLKNVPAGFADGTDNDTQYSAGAGLSLSVGNQFSVNFPSPGTESGGAVTAARSDHIHDTRYFTESELQDPTSARTINTATNPVSWRSLKDVPTGIADGTDQDTTYSAGTGLSLNAANQFSVVYGSAANTAAQGNDARFTTNNAFIQNQTTVQAAANFNVAGRGIVGTQGTTNDNGNVYTFRVWRDADEVAAKISATRPQGNQAIFEVRHSNDSQGIGLGFNTIAPAGFNTSQDMTLTQKGGGTLNLTASNALININPGSLGNLQFGSFAGVNQRSPFFRFGDALSNGDPIGFQRADVGADNSELIVWLGDDYDNTIANQGDRFVVRSTNSGANIFAVHTNVSPLFRARVDLAAGLLVANTNASQNATTQDRSVVVEGVGNSGNARVELRTQGGNPHIDFATQAIDFNTRISQSDNATLTVDGSRLRVTSGLVAEFTGGSTSYPSVTPANTVVVEGADNGGTNPRVELRGNAGATPYIDFATGGVDNQGRIRMIAPNQLAIENATLAVGLTAGSTWDCPTGWTAVSNGRLCMSPLLGATQAFNAVSTCAAQAAHICTHGEMAQACSLINPYANNTEGWYGDIGPADDDFQIWNVGTCTGNNTGGARQSNSANRVYRCCM